MNDFINESVQFIYTNWYDIVLVVLFLIVGLIYVTVNNIQLLPTDDPDAAEKKTAAEFVIETFNIRDELDFNVDPCMGNTGDLAKHKKYCSSLTEGNCKLSNCCVFAFNKQNGKENTDGKCVAGDEAGPIVKNDSANMDYYYYKNKEFRIVV